MRNAKDVPLGELLPATRRVIDHILQNMPTGASQPGYNSDTDDAITGFKGVRVILYTHGDGSGGVVKNLQVSGPEQLAAAVQEAYPHLDPWGRKLEHLVFHIE